MRSRLAPWVPPVAVRTGVQRTRPSMRSRGRPSGVIRLSLVGTTGETPSPQGGMGQGQLRRFACAGLRWVQVVFVKLLRITAYGPRCQLAWPERYVLHAGFQVQFPPTPGGWLSAVDLHQIRDQCRPPGTKSRVAAMVAPSSCDLQVETDERLKKASAARS